MTSDLAARLALGLNGDPDQRAATTLLATAAHGVWLAKLACSVRACISAIHSSRWAGSWVLMD